MRDEGEVSELVDGPPVTMYLRPTSCGTFCWANESEKILPTMDDMTAGVW